MVATFQFCKALAKNPGLLVELLGIDFCISPLKPLSDIATVFKHKVVTGIMHMEVTCSALCAEQDSVDLKYDLPSRLCNIPWTQK